MMTSFVWNERWKRHLIGAGILACALVFLFAHLDLKPPQHDEGVNGWFIEEVIAKGFYDYDPANYHGPLHFYILFFFKLLLGSNLWALRLPAVIFSFGAVYLMLRLRPFLGTFTAFSGALLTAVSPGMIFYSRYAIHESALFFFSVMTFLGFLRFCAKKDKASLWLLGMGMTGMIVTKETFVLTVGVFVAAFVLLKLYELISPSSDPPVRVATAFHWQDIAQVFAVCFLVVLTLYSGFFLNIEGFFGIFKSIFAWVKTGISEASEQKGHWKPFIYWARLFLEYEWAAFAGLLFAFPLLAPVPRWHRLLLFYSAGTFLIYSAISYKTPWCIMQIIWPFLFVTAAGLETWFRHGRLPRLAALAALLIFAAFSIQKAYRVNFVNYVDEKESYVHVQTFQPIMRVHERLQDLIKKDPTLAHMPIHVVMKSYWPISWLLGDFTDDGYYTEHYPAKGDAGLIFCDLKRRTRLELKLKENYYVEKFRLNPAQDEIVVYYDAVIFKEYFNAETEMFRPQVFPEPGPGQGLKLDFYGNSKWEGEIARSEILPTVNLAWDRDDAPQPRPLSMIIEGDIYVPDNGAYEFFLASDDGSDLRIGDQVYIDNLGEHVEEIKELKVTLNEGWYPFKIRFFDVGGAGVIRFWWKRPGRAEEMIAPEFFRPGGDA